MATINDPQAIKFCDERLRPFSNKLIEVYRESVFIADEWRALGMAAKIPDKADQIDDKAATDGRPVISGASANAIINLGQALIDDIQANDKAKLDAILKVSTRG